ncbi:MAG: TolC family protein, partial [Myxococcales bacterium]|nr:TolC family protein [Myxococcales bacterium]
MSRIAIAAGLAILASACVHPTVRNPRPPFELPESYAAGGEAPAEDERAMPDRWWEAFEDPELSHLVDEALAHNFQLGAAWARYEQSRTGVQASASAWFPQINAQLDAARRRQVVVFGALGRQEFENDSFGMSLPVSYELDVWQRVGHSVAAGAIEMVAARDDVEALAMTLAANVVEGWLELLQQRATRALLEEQLETNRLYAELVALRFAHGLGTALDVHQQQQQLEATEAQLALALGSERVARQQLAVLVGRPPTAFEGEIGSLPEPTVLPAPPPVPRTGIPSHLLLTRPDVRAARRRIEAQDHRVG